MDYDLVNLISLIAEEGVLNPADITPDKTFAELGFDSLDHMQLIGECEHLFEIEISEQDANAALTVAALHQAILAAAPLQPCPACGAMPKRCADPVHQGQHFIGCSNEYKCPVWPVTRSYPTPAEAAQAWRDQTVL